MRRKHGGGRWPARPGNKPGARVDDIGLFQPGIGNRLSHRDIGIGRPRPHETQRALVDMFGRIDVDGPGNLAAKPVFGHLRAGFDPGFTCLEAGQNLPGIVPDG